MFVKVMKNPTEKEIENRPKNILAYGKEKDVSRKESEKIKEWKRFSESVENHIESYVLAQYGDYPDEMIESFTIQSIKEQLMRYVSRIGRSARSHDEELRDTLKIAHYACYLRKKIFDQYLNKPRLERNDENETE